MGLFSRLKNWADGDILYEIDLEAEFDNLYDNIIAGTTGTVGMVQLEDSHSSTSTAKAACPKNVKEAYDLVGMMKRNLISANWTSRTSAADNSWYSVCWSPELTLFVAVANSGTGNRVMTSPDGITWTIRTSAADNSWYSVCWSPN